MTLMNIILRKCYFIALIILCTLCKLLFVILKLTGAEITDSEIYQSPPLYASKWNSNNNGAFSGSFICLKMIAKNGNFQKGGEVPYLGPQNFVGPP
jgi:hypothetical protein